MNTDFRAVTHICLMVHSYASQSLEFKDINAILSEVLKIAKDEGQNEEDSMGLRDTLRDCIYGACVKY